MTNLPNSTRRFIRRLADTIARAAKDPITNAPSHRVIYGTVESISAGPPKTVSVYLSNGSGTVSAGLRYLSSYQPVVGDYVKIEKYGTDMVVVGALNGSTMGIQIPFSFSIMGLLVVSTSSTNTPPPFPFPVPEGQVAKVTAFRAKILGGTSVNIDCQRNGSGITGLTGLDVTTSVSAHVLGTPLELTDGDELGVNINSLDSAPAGLMGAFYIAISG